MEVFNIEVVNPQISETHEPPLITNNVSSQGFAVIFAPLLNSIYIFLIIIGVFVVLSFLGFAIREYTYKIEQLKKKQFKDEDRLDYCWNDLKSTSNSHSQTEKSFIENFGPHKNRVHHWPRGTFSPTFVDKNVEMIGDNYSANNESLQSSEASIIYDFKTAVESMDNLKNIINVIPTRNATLKGDNLLYYYTGVKNNYLAKKRHMYTIDQLLNFNSEDMNIIRFTVSTSVDDFSPEIVNNSELKRIMLNPSFKLHTVKFESIWKAEKEVNEITDCFNNTIDLNSIEDIATKKIMVMRLLSFTSNSKKLHNPNIYISKFDSLMDVLIDYGIFFDLLNTSSSLISQALIDMVLCYVWCHWNFKKGAYRKKILKKFGKWKLEGPSIRPNDVLFRYLLNLELGIYTVGKMDILFSKYSENKIITFLKFVTINSHCNDFVRFVPLIAQAIEYTERIWTKRLLYNILLCIVKKHIHCCIKEYLLDETNFIKQIVQHGFWIQNDSQVIKTAELIHMVIIEKYPSTMSYVISTKT